MTALRGATGEAERGAAATIVAVLAAGGVLLGMLALSVDVGHMTFERRQLQNAADATALALAQVCAQDLADCDVDLTAAHLAALNDANSPSDGSHGLLQAADGVRGDIRHGQCGRVPGASDMPSCSSATATATEEAAMIRTLSQCPPVPAWLKGQPLIPYVETYTRSQSSIGPALDFFFAEGDAMVVSCARAAWGSPGATGTTFPLTIRDCTWNRVTANGTKFAPSPPYTKLAATPDASPVETIPPEVAPYVTHVLAGASSNPSIDCTPTMYTPGGFGWLTEGDVADCRASFGAAGTVSGDPGKAPSHGCKNDGMEQWVGKEIQIPVFGGVAGTGAGTTYTLAGISSFFFAGWSDIPTAGTYSVYVMPDRLPGSTEEDMCMTLDPPPEKLMKASCIWGWFTSPILPVGTIDPTAPPRGTSVIQMTG